MTAATLWDGVHDRLRAQLPPAVALWDSRRPDGAATPGVVLRSSPGKAEPVRLTAASTTRDSRFWTVSVDASADRVRALRRLVEAALVDVRLQVAGLLCWPVRHDDSDVVRPDDGEHPRPALYVGVDVWVVRNRRIT